VEPTHVIGETLVRASAEPRPHDPAWLAALAARAADPASTPADAAATPTDPLVSWIESTLGLRVEPDSGRLLRAQPRTLGGPDGAAALLAELTGVDADTCAAPIAATLLAAGTPPVDGARPVLPLKLHQSFSRGETACASLEPEDARYLTTRGQRYVPGDRDRILLPLAFCRECGQDYYTVGRRRGEGGMILYERRSIGSRSSSGRSTRCCRSHDAGSRQRPTVRKSLSRRRR
jgi:hypothetical protein